MSDLDTLMPFLAEDELGDGGDLDEEIIPKRVAEEDADGDDLVDDLIDPEGFGDEEEGAFDDSE